MKLLLYCTKSKPYLVKEAFKGYMATNNLGVLEEEKERYIFNGKIVAECDYEVEKYLTEKDFFSQKVEIQNKHLYEGVAQYSGTEDMLKNILEKSCISIEKLTRYMSFKKNIID